MWLGERAQELAFQLGKPKENAPKVDVEEEDVDPGDLEVDPARVVTPAAASMRKDPKPAPKVAEPEWRRPARR